MPPVSASLALALAFFSFRLVHPDNAILSRWDLPAPGSRCPTSHATGKREVLAS
jgi:hypothetical protein